MSDTPFKVFETKEEFNDFKSKNHRNGYNELKTKIQERVGDSLGKTYDPDQGNFLDSIITDIKELNEKVSEGISDPTKTPEYIALQEQLKAQKDSLAEAELKVVSVENKYKADSIWSKSISEATKDAELVIPEDKIKKLFESEFEQDFSNGTPFAKKDGKAVTNDDADVMPLGDVVKNYVSDYLKTTAEGTGGEASGGSGAKPKYEDFKNASRDKRYEAMGDLMASAKSAGGWAEPDAPAI